MYALLPLLLLATGCARLWVDPEDALDALGDDLLVLVPGATRLPPPGVMINARKAAAAFEDATQDDRLCPLLVATARASERFARIECKVLGGVPNVFQPRRLPGFGGMAIDLPAPGTPVIWGEFNPHWVLVLDSFYVGYEHRGAGPNGGSVPVIVAGARIAWWSNTRRELAAWGNESETTRTAGWIAPEDIHDAVDDAVVRMMDSALRRAERQRRR